MHYLDPLTQRCGGCGKDATEITDSVCVPVSRRHYLIQAPSGIHELFAPRTFRVTGVR